MRRFIISLTAGLFLLSGCATTETQKKPEPKKEPVKAEQSVKPKEDIIQYKEAVIETNKGTIVFKFFPDVAPNTVKNFIKLAKEKFYDGLVWHRVVPGFVIQGGDPRGDGTGGPGYTIKAEFNNKPHLRGTVAMARANHPDSAGSQFYICLEKKSFLDGQYTVFGQVTEGIDVIDKIRVGDKMLKITVR